MCEVWKWIAILTTVPLVVLMSWTILPLTWLLRTPERLRTFAKRNEKILSYRRPLLLDAVVCFIAVLIYVAHCA